MSDIVDDIAGHTGNDSEEVVAFAPGRVNLIGEHTDYTGGLALPLAIQLGTTVRAHPASASGPQEVRLQSADEPEPAVVPLDVQTAALVEWQPTWARYVAGVVHEVRPERGIDGTVSTTLPIGAGLSSSAALELAVALALGLDTTPEDLATTCQRAEQVASGVPCGVMDQLASAAGVEGHALLVDFTTLAVRPVPIPEAATITVVHSGQARTLAGSAYADRRVACERAAAVVGPLRDATIGDLTAIDDPVDQRRAHHVVTENERVRRFVAALEADDLASAGELLGQSHRSLRDDFEVSTPVLDALVERLGALPGVHGARLTGAGFGGCVVALSEPGALTEGWTVTASAGARLVSP